MAEAAINFGEGLAVGMWHLGLFVALMLAIPAFYIVAAIARYVHMWTLQLVPRQKHKRPMATRRQTKHVKTIHPSFYDSSDKHDNDSTS